MKGLMKYVLSQLYNYEIKILIKMLKFTYGTIRPYRILYWNYSVVNSEIISIFDWEDY